MKHITIIEMTSKKEYQFQYINFDKKQLLNIETNKIFSDIDNNELICHKAANVANVSRDSMFLLYVKKNIIYDFTNSKLHGLDIHFIDKNAKKQERDHMQSIYNFLFEYAKDVIATGSQIFLDEKKAHAANLLDTDVIYLISLENICEMLRTEIDVSDFNNIELLESLFKIPTNLDSLKEILTDVSKPRYTSYKLDVIINYETKFFNKLGYKYMLSNVVTSEMENIITSVSFSPIDLIQYFLIVDKNPNVRNIIKTVIYFYKARDQNDYASILSIDTKSDENVNPQKLLADYPVLRSITNNFMYIVCANYTIILTSTEMYINYKLPYMFNIDFIDFETIYDQYKQTTITTCNHFLNELAEPSNFMFLSYDLFYSCKHYGQIIVPKNVVVAILEKYFGIFTSEDNTKSTSTITDYTFAYDNNFIFSTNVKKKSIGINISGDKHFNFTNNFLMRSVFDLLINELMLGYDDTKEGRGKFAFNKDYKVQGLRIIPEKNLPIDADTYNYFKYKKNLIYTTENVSIELDSSSKNIHAKKSYSKEKGDEEHTLFVDKYKIKIYILKNNFTHLNRYGKIGKNNYLGLLKLPNVNNEMLYVQGHPNVLGMKGYLESISMLLDIELEKLLAAIRNMYKSDSQQVVQQIREIEDKDDEVLLTDEIRMQIDAFVFYTYGISANIYENNELSSITSSNNNILVNKYVYVDGKNVSVYYHPIVEVSIILPSKASSGLKGYLSVKTKVFGTLPYMFSYDLKITDFIKNHKNDIKLFVIQKQGTYLKGIIYKKNMYLPIENYYKLNYDDYNTVTTIDPSQLDLNDSLRQFLVFYQEDQQEIISANLIKYNGKFLQLLLQKYVFYFEVDNLNLKEFEKKVSFSELELAYEPSLYNLIMTDIVENKPTLDFFGNLYFKDERFNKEIYEYNFVSQQYNLLRLTIYDIFRKNERLLEKYINHPKTRRELLEKMLEDNIVLVETGEIRDSIIKKCTPDATYCIDNKVMIMEKYYDHILDLFTNYEKVTDLATNIQTFKHLAINTKLRNDAILIRL